MPDGLNGQETFEFLSKMTKEAREGLVCFSWWSVEDVDRWIADWKKMHKGRRKADKEARARLNALDESAKLELLESVLSEMEDGSIGDINDELWSRVCDIAEGSDDEEEDE